MDAVYKVTGAKQSQFSYKTEATSKMSSFVTQCYQ